MRGGRPAAATPGPGEESRSGLWTFTGGAGLLLLLVAGVSPGTGAAGGASAVIALFAVVAGVSGRTAPPHPLGAANRLTIVRLAVLAALFGWSLTALWSPSARLALGGWVPCLAYGAAALLDAADGIVARRTGSESRFGARLDAETDALGMAVASGLGVLLLKTLPVWYLAAGAARYLFGLGLLIERRLGRRSSPLRPSPFRRRLAGFQMGLLSVCLAPVIEAQWALPSVTALGGPFLFAFAFDYLVVSGRLDPDRGRARRLLLWLESRQRAASQGSFGLAGLLAALALAGVGSGWWALAAAFLGWLLRLPGTAPPAARE